MSVGVEADDLSVIKQKYIESILYLDSDPRLTELLYQNPREKIIGDQMIIELMERYPIEDGYIRQLLGGLTEEGNWRDLNFLEKGAGWIPRIHAMRVLELAKVYRNPNHTLYKSSEIAKAIHKALEYWFKTKPVSGNWWYNEIGMPKVLGSVFVLFEEQLSQQEKIKCFEVMDKSQIGMTAQNKIWLAGNVIVKGILRKDIQMIKVARDAINSEIEMAYGKTEGIKVDHSFHQHGPQQQIGNYGAAYLASISFWANVLNGTSLALEPDRFKIVCDYVNNGIRRVLWKNKMDINNLGRQLYRNAQTHKSFSTLFSVNALAQVNGLRNKDFRALIEENIGSTTILPEQYHFWKSDITIHRRPYWMSSLRMSSSRVIGTESGTDNVKGYYLADGALYTYVDGEEYTDIFPCWDWRKVPGVTCYQEDKPVHVMGWLEKQNKSSFAGNVNNGKVGITSMDLLRDGLYAKKTWVFTSDYVLCLGSGICSDSNYCINTSIEQALLKEQLLYLNKNGKWTAVKDMSFSGNNPERFFHRQTGYIILDGKGRAMSEKKTGFWNDIMKIYPKTEQVTQNIYTLYFNHGISPQNASYQYLVLPATSCKKVKRFNLSSFRIVSNTTQCQAVQIDKNTYLLAMYDKGTISLSKDLVFRSNKKGLFILQLHKNELKLYVSDPTQEEETVEVIINGKILNIVLPKGELKGSTILIERII